MMMASAINPARPASPSDFTSAMMFVTTSPKNGRFAPTRSAATIASANNKSPTSVSAPVAIEQSEREPQPSAYAKMVCRHAIALGCAFPARHFRSAERFALCDRALKTSVDALTDHAALKLGERAADLKHQLACRCVGASQRSILRLDARDTQCAP